MLFIMQIPFYMFNIKNITLTAEGRNLALAKIPFTLILIPKKDFASQNSFIPFSFLTFCIFDKEYLSKLKQYQHRLI